MKSINVIPSPTTTGFPCPSYPDKEGQKNHNLSLTKRCIFFNYLAILNAKVSLDNTKFERIKENMVLESEMKTEIILLNIEIRRILLS